jgi:Predicted integral membrane protein (DUF2269)
MLIVRLLHILISFWFIAGLIGRNLTFRQAGQAAEVGSAVALLRASERFELLMVRPGSLAVLVLGFLTAWLQGQPILGFLQGATTNWLLASLALSLIPVLLVVFVLLPHGKLRAAAVAAALAAGSMTPGLRAALADRAVITSRNAELAITAAIVVLMAAKPF